MKQLHAVLVSAATSSLLTALFLHAPPAVNASAGGAGAQAQESCARENGDVNADGKIDLADPITILGHLFQGSPTELVPLCAPPAAPSGLPDTGQTKCFDDAGKEIPCDSATCPGQDAAYATGCPPEGRFTDNGDGTVTDHCTDLMWQKDTADTNGDGQVPDDKSDALLCCDALNYCENLSFAGHDDWRLPNVRELQSIVDYSSHDPAIAPVFKAVSSFYWSATSNVAASAFGPTFEWDVYFGDGGVGRVAKDGTQIYVRAVRNAP
jgi:hypothetical protein